MSLITTELDYDVVREPWNRYELDGGPILKIKYILVGLSKRPQEGAPDNYAVKGHNVVDVSHVPIGMRGRPADRKYSPQETQSAITNDDVRYSTLNEEWNEYRAEDGAKIRIKISVISVALTSLFNMDGAPIYHVGSSVMVNVRPPKR
jgi:hypothetical protein